MSSAENFTQSYKRVLQIQKTLGGFSYFSMKFKFVASDISAIMAVNPCRAK